MALSQEQLNKLLQDDLTDLTNKHEKLDTSSMLMVILEGANGLMHYPEKINTIASFVNEICVKHQHERRLIIDNEIKRFNTQLKSIEDKYL